MPKAKTDEVPEGHVTVRITKFGDGKVSSGVHVAEEGDIMLAKDESIVIAKSVADELEVRGFAEIVPDA